MTMIRAATADTINFSFCPSVIFSSRGSTLAAPTGIVYTPSFEGWVRNLCLRPASASSMRRLACRGSSGKLPSCTGFLGYFDGRLFGGPGRDRTDDLFHAMGARPSCATGPRIKDSVMRGFEATHSRLLSIDSQTLQPFGHLYKRSTVHFAKAVKLSILMDACGDH